LILLDSQGAGQAVAAAGKAVPLKGDGPGDLRKSQRQHGQVDTGQAHRKPAKNQRTQRRHQRPQQQGEFHWKAGTAREQRRAISTETKIGRVPERMHARRPHDEVQAGCKQGRHQQINHQHRGVRRTGGHDGQRRQSQPQHGGRHKVAAGGTT
jgi:hypothetical protein